MYNQITDIILDARHRLLKIHNEINSLDEFEIARHINNCVINLKKAYNKLLKFEIIKIDYESKIERYNINNELQNIIARLVAIEKNVDITTKDELKIKLYNNANHLEEIKLCLFDCKNII